MNIRLAAKKILKKIGLFRPIKKTVIFYRGRINPSRIKLDGSVELPKKAILEFTLNCNLRCKMCFQKSERAAGKKDMNFAQIKQMLDNLGSQIRHIGLIGGEVFLRPDIFDILAEFERRKITTHITTNGTLLTPQKIKQVNKFKHLIKGIGVSLDGLEETHNEIRRVNGSFAKSIQAIELLAKEYAVNINCVVFKENLAQIIPLIKLLKQKGVVNFSLQFELFSTKPEINCSAKRLNIPINNFQVQQANSPNYHYSYDEIDKKINEIRKIKGIDIMIQPLLFDKYPQYYYQGMLRSKVRLICKDLFACRINAQGKVIFCPFIKKEIGDLLDCSLASFWNNREVKELRVKLMKGNLVDVCKRCCRLGILSK